MKQVDKHQVHQKIRLKLWVYAVVFLVSLMLSMIHFVNGHILFYFPLGGFFAGISIGFAVSRMHKITWDKNGEVIITKLDSVGLVILLVYVFFIIFKDTIIEDIVHLHNISSISLAVLSGTMLGHALALRKRIISFYLKDQAAGTN
jgi:hypothetical protein